MDEEAAKAFALRMNGGVVRTSAEIEELRHEVEESSRLHRERILGGAATPEEALENLDVDKESIKMVLSYLDMPPLHQLSFLLNPQSWLNGRTPLDAIKQGQVNRVLAMAPSIGDMGS